MAAATLPFLKSCFLVCLLVLLHCSTVSECSTQPETSDENLVVKWAEGTWYFVPSKRSSKEGLKKTEFEDTAHQEGKILEEGSQPLRRARRDIQEIIEGRPVNFPPVVVQRTMDALKQILALLGGIEKAVYTVPTTPAPPISSPSPPTPQPVIKTSTKTPLPLTNSSTENTTLPPSPNPAAPMVSSTEAPSATTQTPAKNESVSAKPSENPSTPPAEASTKSPSSQRLRVEATTSKGDVLRSRVRSLVRGLDAEPIGSPSGDTTTPTPETYSPYDVIIIFKDLSENAEDVMTDRLNMSTVIALEKSVQTLTLVNKTAAYIDRGDGFSELKIWLLLDQTSCKHALKKLQYGKQVMALFGHSDDITILITAAFCTLALICCIIACLVGNRPLKPSRGDYRLGGTPGTARPVPSTRRHISSASSSDPPERQFSVYSSPARAAASARSNPSDSSHRSVDVDPSASYRPAENNLNYDEPRTEEDENVPDPAVAAKNERNTSLGKDRPVPSRPSTRTSDYKDPRRHRSNLARGRTNEGFSGDEVIGVRSDSESVL